MAELEKLASAILKDLNSNAYFSYYVVKDIIRDGMKEPLLKRGTRIDRKKAETILRVLGDVPIKYSDKKLKDVQDKKRAIVTRADWLSVEEALRSRMKGTAEAKWGVPLLDTDVFLDIVDELEDTAPPELLRVMALIQENNYRLYLHCFMTGLLAAGIAIILHDKRKGKKLEAGKNAFMNNEIFMVAAGGFLHHVGPYVADDVKISKVHQKQIDAWIESNPPEYASKITEIFQGFLYILSKKVFSTLTAHILLEVNEKIDGSGFPEGKKGKNIHEYARIVALSNRFAELWYSFEDEFIEQKQQLKLTLQALMKGVYRDEDGVIHHKEYEYEFLAVLLELFK